MMSRRPPPRQALPRVAVQSSGNTAVVISDDAVNGKVLSACIQVADSPTKPANGAQLGEAHLRAVAAIGEVA